MAAAKVFPFFLFLLFHLGFLRFLTWIGSGGLPLDSLSHLFTVAEEIPAFFSPAE
jgi:hypothetical protein